jgi:hypothetical protein
MNHMADQPTPARPKQPGQVTIRDVNRYPYYYLRGAGRPATEQSECEHGYQLTSSCPCCP